MSGPTGRRLLLTRRRVLAGTAALLAAATAGSGCSAGGPAGPGGGGRQDEGVQTIRYGDHPSQIAELSLPSGTSLVPVVVVVHGGFWREAYGFDLGRPLAADLVSRGWAALNVEYRRVGDSAEAGGGGWPATCLDVAAAVDSLAEEGQRIAGGRLDLSRVVALGHSAGGHLAGWLASRAGQDEGAPGASPQVSLTGAVLQAGVVDLVGGYDADLGGGAVLGLMGASPTEAMEAYAQASPTLRVPLGVPTVCVHGHADDVVPILQSQTFVAAATGAGDESQLLDFDGDHMDVVDTEHPAWKLCVSALQRLL